MSETGNQSLKEVAARQAGNLGEIEYRFTCDLITVVCLILATTCLCALYNRKDYHLLATQVILINTQNLLY